MPSIKFLFFILVAGALIPQYARAQARTSYNLCAAGELSRFHQATDNHVRDHRWDPPAAAAGQRVGVIGEGYDAVPVQGTFMNLYGCRGRNCAERTDRDVPVTVVSPTRLEIQLPNDMEIRDDGRLLRQKYVVQSTQLLYRSPSPCNQSTDFRDAGISGGYRRNQDPIDDGGPTPPAGNNSQYNANIPSPTNVRAVAHSDTVINLNWDYASNQAIDGFRVYRHWCKRVFRGDCSRPPDLNDLKNPTVWLELTNPQQRIIVPPGLRNEFEAVIPTEPVFTTAAGQQILDHYRYTSFVDSSLFYVMTAYSAAGGESVPSPIARVDLQDRYGCYTPQPARPGGAVTVGVEAYPDEVNSSGERIRTPFFHAITQDRVRQFPGNATALYDANVSDGLNLIAESFVSAFPISTVDFQPLQLSYHLKAHPNGFFLRPSRGYAWDRDRETNNLLKANLIITGQFGNDPTTNRPFYVAAHLFYDARTGRIVPIALLAGQDVADTPGTVGMAVAGSTRNPRDNQGQPLLRATINRPVLPNGQTPGSLSGTVEGIVYALDVMGGTFQTQGEYIQGEYVEVTQVADTQFIDWKNKITLNFNLPLHDDRCW